MSRSWRRQRNDHETSRSNWAYKQGKKVKQAMRQARREKIQRQTIETSE